MCALSYIYIYIYEYHSSCDSIEIFSVPKEFQLISIRKRKQCGGVVLVNSTDRNGSAAIGYRGTDGISIVEKCHQSIVSVSLHSFWNHRRHPVKDLSFRVSLLFSFLPMSLSYLL